jgi:hypothetical protein
LLLVVVVVVVVGWRGLRRGSDGGNVVLIVLEGLFIVMLLHSLSRQEEVMDILSLDTTK